LYRVSSRSFPNRQAIVDEAAQRVRIVPKAGHESDVLKNPYIAYNCARLIGDTAIVTNGSHTDPIAEKVAAGMPLRDAFVAGLWAMDYEKDDYNTPRIAAAVRRGDEMGWLGVVRRDGLDVQSFRLEPGTCIHLSTYEHCIPGAVHTAPFAAGDALEACTFALGEGVFARFTLAVTAVSAFESRTGFALAARDAARS
jgi:IMP cyclohydrolase